MDIREKITEILCRQCDGISRADTCELEKSDCPVLTTAPDQILAIKVEDDRLCPDCEGQGSTSVTNPVYCPRCNHSGELSGRTLKELIESITPYIPGIK